MYGDMKASGEFPAAGLATNAMRNRTWRVALLLAILLVLVWASAASAGELWLVSSRSVCSPACSNLEALEVWKSGPDNNWVASTAHEFLSTAAPEVPITLFLHGNRADLCRSIAMGWQVYNALQCDAGERPFRMVIWSWPSDQIRGPRRDAEAKICRSDEEVHLLARFLGRLRGDARLNLLGYSLGARIATGALAERSGNLKTPVRAMLVAAAEDSDWLAAGHCHGGALDRLERALVTCNPCDRALRLYPRVSGGASAMGFTGPSCCSGDEQCAKLDTANVSGEVGREHNWENYFSAPDVRCRLAWYAFLADSPATTSVAANP